VSVIPSITIDNVVAALANFLDPLMPSGTQIVRAQVNRVAMPPPPCIVLTELGQYDLATTVNEYDGAAVTGTFVRSTRADIQIDFYDGQAGEMCGTTKTLLRSMYAADKFPLGISPLYCSDGIQSPLIDGEQQYVSRWTVTASLQYNATITVTAEQFDTVGETGVVAADLINPV
jgi:hypothetical protein